MRRRFLWSAGLAGGAFLALVAAALPVKVATLRLPRQDGRLVAAVLIAPDDRVVLTYRHSVEKTLVTGRFRFGPNLELLAESTSLESVGAGLPNQAVKNSRREGISRVVDEGGREIGRLRFFYLSLNQTRLSLAGRAMDLSGLPEGGLMLVAGERPRLWRLILWRLAGPAWPAEEER